MKRLLFAISAILLAALRLSAQEKEQADSLVRLLSADFIQQYEENAVVFRKVVGNARFLHNDTFLLCDTALWNVDTGVIEAWCNVSILQDQTVLTSDRMTYLLNEDLAQFRGSLVQLQDKDNNTLRTRHLDYNTKDSTATFTNGASMRDKDGQIIESKDGFYDSKAKTFTFTRDVNMFSDSVFVTPSQLRYESEISTAHFFDGTNAWKDGNMLSSEDGWYDKDKELFFFRRNVHVLTEDQEAWSDSLFFHRNTMEVEMLGNAQVNDTTRNVYALAGRIEYIDSLSRITLTRKPAVISMTEEKGQKDTVYVGAEKLIYYTRRMCDISDGEKKISEERLASVAIDPVGLHRKKAAEEAAKKAAEEAAEDPNNPNNPVNLKNQAANARKMGGSKDAPDKSKGQGSAAEQAAAMEEVPAVDEGMESADPAQAGEGETDEQLEAPKDTTEIGYLSAVRNVRIFRKDMQAICDSLQYTDLDSLARLYKDPVVWNEITHQYVADSILLMIENNAMKKANLLSNAFIHIQEDTLHYNQIRGAELTAFFDPEGQLERFDALGGASMLFYLEENGVLATVNKKDSKMLSATLKDGNVQNIRYFEDAKSDAYPVVQMTDEDRFLKGFAWTPEKRPADRYAITDIDLRPGERTSYEARPRANFRETDDYFPGYISGIYREMEQRDSLQAVLARERRMRKILDEERQKFVEDSIKTHLADSLAKAGQLHLADSLRQISQADSIARNDSISKLHRDSLSVAQMDPKEAERIAREKARAQKKADREAAKLARNKAREDRWVELDKKDAEKAARKAEKKAAKLRKQKLKALEAAEKQARKDAAMLEKYKERFRKQEEKKSKRKNG